MKLAMMMMAWLAAGALSHPAHAEDAHHVRVAFPEVAAEPSCASGGGLSVAAYRDRSESSGAFAQRELQAWFESGRDDLLLVLGADQRALWVIEAYVPNDACDSLDCAHIVLREVGFDGVRRAHTLDNHEGWERFDMPLSDLIHKRLEAWQILSGGAVRPVPYQVNLDQQPAGADGISTWAVRVRDSLHKKSYVWRRHTSPFMCWCATSYEVSTYSWAPSSV